MSLSRSFLVVCVAAAALLTPAAASARSLADVTLAADAAERRSCIERPLAGAAHTGIHRTAAPGLGRITARLSAGAGDWDLALFDARDRSLVAGAAGPTAREIAQGIVLERTPLLVQACRRTGGARAARITVDFDAIDPREGSKAQLVHVSVPNRARLRDLQGLGLDMTEHGGNGFHAVVLYGPQDAEKLRKARFQWKVEVADLGRESIRHRAADRRYARTVRRSAFPSGQDTYRRLPDYEEDLKQLADENPELVRLFTLPHRTYEGRQVVGIEITQNVEAPGGKPVFLQMGVHHAREWPSGEHAIEWAYELINGYKAGDARARRLVRETRTIVVPVVNPDGFNWSREAGQAAGAGGGRGGIETANFLLIPAEYHRKNCRFPPPREDQGGDCEQSPGTGLVQPGVDPNRNYGGFWGGPGASGDPFSQSYYGPGPFSEPETQNIRGLVSTRHVTTLITNHTYSNLVLRPPGTAVQGQTPDEPVYKALADSMAAENGYASQFGYELYDTTGTTEDWTYYATGGLGFTFEIGPSNFHPPFADAVAEWEGTTEAADDPDGDGTPERNGGGNRAAYYKAQENTADDTKHSVLEGEVLPGVMLRLKKTFQTPTSRENEDGSTVTITDTLDTTLPIADSGRFEWHVNPSTRPLVARDRGRVARGEPSPAQEFSPSSPTVPCPTYFEVGPGSCVNGWADHPFEIPGGSGIDNAAATIRIEWPTPAEDYDLEVYRDVNGNGVSDAEDGEPVGSSTQGTTDAEETTLGPDPQPGKYVIRVINWSASGGSYSGTITFSGPDPFEPARIENWTLTCETLDGRVLESQELVIARGERKTPQFSRCRRDAPPPPPPAATPEAAEAVLAGLPSSAGFCASRAGFLSTRVRPVRRGRKVRLDFVRRFDVPVDVDVFQVSKRRRITREVRVAVFRNRERGVVWNGKANVKRRKLRNGVYFVRFRGKGVGRRDWRRHTLVRKRGRFHLRRTFYRPDSCGFLSSAKLYRPVFGGRQRYPLRVAFRVSREATVTVAVRRGGRTVKRWRKRGLRPRTTHRVLFRKSGRQWARGRYRVVIRARGTGSKARAVLVAHRL